MWLNASRRVERSTAHAENRIPSPTICFIFLREYGHFEFCVPSHPTQLDCRVTFNSQIQLSIKNQYHPSSFDPPQQSECHSHQQKTPAQKVKSCCFLTKFWKTTVSMQFFFPGQIPMCSGS